MIYCYASLKLKKNTTKLNLNPSRYAKPPKFFYGSIPSTKHFNFTIYCTSKEAHEILAITYTSIYLMTLNLRQLDKTHFDNRNRAAVMERLSQLLPYWRQIPTMAAPRRIEFNKVISLRDVTCKRFIRQFNRFSFWSQGIICWFLKHGKITFTRALSIPLDIWSIISNSITLFPRL